MSGHSKWATTKHRKAAQDAKRSALFSKLSRNITVAAKEGGDPNPDNNASLAAAIEKAKGYSLPKDKIKVAIDKAFGSGKDSANYETVVYEGYGPAGVAVLCEALTDNRNRTAADVRAAFSHAGGNLGTSGSVAFQFERKRPDHGSQRGRDRRQEEPREAERRRCRRGRVHARCGRGRRRRLRGRRGRVDRLHVAHRSHGREEGARGSRRRHEGRRK